VRPINRIVGDLAEFTSGHRWAQALVARCRSIPNRRYEMKRLPSIVELREKLGNPSSETVETVRLLKAFLKLAPRQRFEVIELVEQLATDPGPDRRLS
jgi:hypothetical protein